MSEITPSAAFIKLTSALAKPFEGALTEFNAYLREASGDEISEVKLKVPHSAPDVRKPLQDLDKALKSANPEHITCAQKSFKNSTTEINRLFLSLFTLTDCPETIRTITSVQVGVLQVLNGAMRRINEAAKEAAKKLPASIFILGVLALSAWNWGKNPPPNA